MTKARSAGAVAVALGALVLVAGCSDADKKTDENACDPTPRTGEQVEEEVGALSSGVLDAMGIKAKVTDTKPMAGPYDGASEEDRARIVRHPWSVHGVRNEVLQSGMDNLAVELPKRGWKIVKSGPDASRNRNLEVSAVHLKTRAQLEMTWMKGLDGHAALISVDVYSRCFREPDRAERAAGEG
ncbi:hypothetical protein AAHZ94_18125 [Streptomyces sp. HSW2009]|uniref:hypothetical protein n=1 Tax=Streptomyces sp. HSW2009 TaxID=3142890 RepID=UPI0032EC0FF7